MKRVSKKVYVISLGDGATAMVTNIALYAAESNGRENHPPFPFSEIVEMVMDLKRTDNQRDAMTVTVEEADGWLCVDMKRPRWEGYKTVLKIEQIEVSELVLEDE